MTIKEALLAALKSFGRNNRNAANLDIEIILSYVIKKTREYLYTHPESKLNKLQQSRFLKLIRERVHGIPVAYLTQTKYFWGLNFKVSKNVLIPRPETELLVEKTINLVKNKFSNRATIADIGTGSGAIAISLAKELPSATIYATDKSIKALLIAKYNSKKNKTKVKFFTGDLVSPLHNKKIDILVANLPYLPQSYKNPTIMHEPKSALYSGADGLDAYRRLINLIKKRKQQPQYLILEIGAKQAEKLSTYIKKFYPQAQVELFQDLAGLDRLLQIKLTP